MPSINTSTISVRTSTDCPSGLGILILQFSRAAGQQTAELKDKIKAEPVFDIRKIQRILPHRYPFLFVDRVIALEGGRSVDGLYQVNAAHPLLNHSGEQPLFPSLLLVEALGQVAALAIRTRPVVASGERRPQGFLVRVDHCRFLCAAIRLVLDYAKDVEEAVSLLGRYNIDFTGGPPVHYLVSDPAPRSVVIEFLDNEMIVIPSDAAWQVATNFVMTGYPFGDPPSGCWRYNLVYDALEGKNGAVTSDGAMELLEDCSQPITMWSVVYGGDKTVRVAAGRQFAAPHRYTFDELKSLR